MISLPFNKFGYDKIIEYFKKMKIIFFNMNKTFNYINLNINKIKYN